MHSYSNFKYLISIFIQFWFAASSSLFVTSKLHSWRPEHQLSSSGRTSLLHPMKSSASVIQRPTDIRPNSADVTTIICSLAHATLWSSALQTSTTSERTHQFPGEMEFSPTSSPYPAQSRVAARIGFDDECEKTHLSWKPCEMHFLPCYITYFAQTNRFITTNWQQLTFWIMVSTITFSRL